MKLLASDENYVVDLVLVANFVLMRGVNDRGQGGKGGQGGAGRGREGGSGCVGICVLLSLKMIT